MSKRRFFLVLCLALGGILSLSGCKPLDYSSPLSGINLAANQDFSVNWQREIENDPGVASGDRDKYLIFAPLSAADAGTTAGLPNAGASIYRLEIPNLFPNGDFEASLVTGPIGWDSFPPGANPAPAFSIETPTSPPAASGSNRLKFDKAGDTEIRIDAGLVDIDYTRGWRFNLQFDLIPDPNFFTSPDQDANMHFTFGAASIPDSITLSLVAGRNVYQGSFLSAQTSGTARFSLGDVKYPQDQEGWIDNIRVSRTDIPHSNRIAVKIPYSEAGRLDLALGGTFTFSVWVKREQASQLSPNQPNRFDASGLTLGIHGMDYFIPQDPATGAPLPPVLKTQIGQRVDISGVRDDRWTLVSVTETLIFNPPPNPQDPALMLSICPTDWTGTASASPGSLLISSPSLTVSSSK
ncbi:MAG: hypothetical protein LBQ61_00835 [Spirochaetales bacterium]|jgi:hypothetical protein|nr:hypothetical protein [Spirochaetales bacterium]